MAKNRLTSTNYYVIITANNGELRVKGEEVSMQNADPKTIVDELLSLIKPAPAPKPPREKYYNGNRGPDERRVAHSEKRAFEVSEMWEVHHEIVRRLVLGQKNADIARDLKVSPAMVSYVRNSPVVRDKLEVMKGARDADTIDLAKRIREDAPQALRLLEDIIAGEVDGQEVAVGLRAREANNMMNRAGYAPVQNIKGQILHAHYDAEDIEDIKKRAHEDGLKSGLVIEAEVVEIKDETNKVDSSPIDSGN